MKELKSLKSYLSNLRGLVFITKSIFKPGLVEDFTLMNTKRESDDSLKFVIFY